MYALHGKLQAHPGARDALAAHLLDAARALQAVDGCLLYVVSRDPADPDAVWVTEAWRRREDHQASLQLDAVRALIAAARPLIAAMPGHQELEPLGGKGLPDPAP